MFIGCCSKCKFTDLWDDSKENKCLRCGGEMVSLGIEASKWNQMSNDEMRLCIDDTLREYSTDTSDNVQEYSAKETEVLSIDSSDVSPTAFNGYTADHTNNVNSVSSLKPDDSGKNINETNIRSNMSIKSTKNMGEKEKKLIDSEFAGSVRTLPTILIVLGLFFSALMLYVCYDSEYGYGQTLFIQSGAEFEFMFIMGIVLVIIAIILLIYFNKCSMTVTDKRVYGTAAFGKRVDLPMDKISAVGLGFFKSIAVATSSGKISFFGIKNRYDIHMISGELIANRTTNRGKEVSVTNIKASTSAEELKQYKELLDEGIISQEEFDAKKKQLLNL